MALHGDMARTVAHRLMAYAACLLLLSSCAAALPLLPDINFPRHVPQAPLVIKDRPVIAFVLGSGAARGFAHVGVLNVLEEGGLKADLVVGSSAGSVVGAFYAGGIRGQALVDAAQQLEMKQVTDWALSERGLVKGERLQEYVNKLLDFRPIEALPTRFAAVATDLGQGELMVFNHGDTGMAVRASSAIPGVVQPVLIGTREYMDGGVVSRVPVHVARTMGADLVIAIDVSRKPLPLDQLTSSMAVMHQALIVMGRRLSGAEMAEADIVIRPEVGDMGIGEFELRDMAIAAGQAAARSVLAEIKRKVAEKTALKHQSQM